MRNKPQQKIFTKEEILHKLETYCAYRERCESEVRQKLYLLEVKGEDANEYLDYLRENNYLNEERFISAFTRGKFNIKSWGKKKIVAELRSKNIEEKKIAGSVNDLDEGLYFLRLQDLLEKKSAKIRETDAYKKRQKLMQFALQKGYESELIQEALKGFNI